MPSMAPCDVGGEAVHANPWEGLLFLVEAGKLLNCGFVLRDAGMTNHAFGGFGDPHVLTGIAIRVAIGAFQAKFEMGLVAIGKRLRRSGPRIRNFVGGLLSRGKRRSKNPQQTQTSR